MYFWCCAPAEDYGYILNNCRPKQSGKVKGFRVTSETEDKITNEHRIQLIKGSVMLTRTRPRPKQASKLTTYKNDEKGTLKIMK